jgi:aspartate aminotransferase
MDKIIFDDSIHFSFAAISKAFPRTLTINDFSKTYAITGWRLGYVAGPEEIIRQLQRSAKMWLLVQTL